MLCANREDDDDFKMEFVDEKDALYHNPRIWTTMFSIKQDQDKRIFKFHPHTCVVQEHWEKIKKAEDILRNEKLVHLKLPKQSLVKFRLQTHTNGELKQETTYILHVTESRPSENILQSQRKMYQSQASKLGPALQDLARLILKMQIYSIEFDKIPVSQQMEEPWITLLNLEQLVFDEADARFTREERFVMALGLGRLGLGRSDDGFLRCLTAENSDAVSSVLADSDFKYIVCGEGYKKAIEHRREEAKYDNSEFWNETILKYEKEAAKITRYLKMFFPPESVPSPGSKIHVNKLDSVDHARILRYAPHRFKVSGNTSGLQGVICLGPDSELLALSAFVEGVKDLDKKNIEQLERHICAEIEQSQPKAPDHKRTEGEDMSSKTAENMDGLESEKSRSDVQVRHFKLHPSKEGTLLTFGVMSKTLEEWAIERPMKELCDSTHNLKKRYQSFLTRSFPPTYG
ncbi:hypothetical protein N7512_009367 [Penicillium capsulatum]|nr:hypothetical protein N7512_009367 [Penicillium capsulatum]